MCSCVFSLFIYCLPLMSLLETSLYYADQLSFCETFLTRHIFICGKYCNYFLLDCPLATGPLTWFSEYSAALACESIYVGKYVNALLFHFYLLSPVEFVCLVGFGAVLSFMVLGSKPRAWQMSHEHSVTEPYP